MSTALTVLIVVCLILGGLALGTLALACVLRWMQRPIEPPECCIGGEDG